MERKNRIAAGAIIINDNEILLVRYSDRAGKTYLAAPGGGADSEEGLSRAAVREVKEETGIEVKPDKILCVEELLSGKCRMIKIWFLCHVTGGRLERTQGAIDENIIEAGWYSREDLENEVVYPSIIMDFDWELFFKDNWEAKYLELKYAEF